MNELSLIIPTVFHRSHFLRRTLTHLFEINFLGDIIVADHSPIEQHACKNVTVEFQRGLTLHYRKQAEDLHFLERIIDAAGIVSSEFVMLHADDDFAFIPGMEECVDHLKKNNKSVLCQGRMAHISLHARAGQHEIVHSQYARRARTEENSLIRLVMLLENYCSSLYAVHRRQCLLEAAQHTLRYSRDLTYWQYLLSSVSVLQGHNAVVEELHYLRQKHKESWSAAAFNERNQEHVPWIFLSPDFSSLTQNFRAGIKNFILINLGEPKENFWPHFDEACLWLFRRALGCGAKDSHEKSEELFFSKLGDPQTKEYAAILRCGQLMAQTE